MENTSDISARLRDEVKQSHAPVTGYYIACAIVTMKYGDLPLAIKDYDRFLKTAPDNRIYKAMRSTAIRLVGQCRTKVVQSELGT